MSGWQFVWWYVFDNDYVDVSFVFFIMSLLVWRMVRNNYKVDVGDGNLFYVGGVG